MDYKEFQKLVLVIKSVYSNQSILLNDLAMSVWYNGLSDIPYPVAEMSITKWIQTNKFAPTIADIRELATQITSPAIADWSEAWQKAIHAVKQYGYLQRERALESLDPITRKCVERIGYLELCMTENPTADRANFRMIYEALAKGERERQQIALPLQEAIKGLQGFNSMLEEGKTMNSCNP